MSKIEQLEMIAKPNLDWAKLPLFDRSKWETVRFGDVVELVSDTSRNPEAEGITRFIGMEHLEPGSLHIKTWGELVDGVTFTKRCRKGQVLFGKRRAYQRKVAIAEFDAVVSGDIYVFQAKEELLDPKLLPFICMSERFFQFAVETSAGSLSPRTNWSHLKDFEFALPPLDQQRRIAGLLWAVDEVHTEQLRTESALRVYADADANEHFSQSASSVASYVELKQVCSRQPQSGIYKGPDFLGRGARLVNMGELFGNDILDDGISMNRIDLTAKEIENYSLTPNDILFGRRSIVLEGAGKCAMVSKHTEPMVFESSILRITLDPKKIMPGYLFAWLRSPEGVQAITRIRSFTTIAGITGSSLAKIKVPLIPLGKQVEAFEMFVAHEERTKTAKRAVNDTKTLLSSLISASI